MSFVQYIWQRNFKTKCYVKQTKTLHALTSTTPLVRQIRIPKFPNRNRAHTGTVVPQDAVSGRCKITSIDTLYRARKVNP